MLAQRKRARLSYTTLTGTSFLETDIILCPSPSKIQDFQLKFEFNELSFDSKGTDAASYLFLDASASATIVINYSRFLYQGAFLPAAASADKCLNQHSIPDDCQYITLVCLTPCCLSLTLMADE